MKKIKDLINKEKHVYIILKNEDIAKRFLSDAESEGHNLQRWYKTHRENT